MNQALIAPLIVALGFIINPLTSLLKREHFPQWFNALIAVILSAIGGIIVVAMSGQLGSLSNPATWAADAGLVYAASQAVYYGLFSHLSLNQVLTNIGPPPVQPKSLPPVVPPVPEPSPQKQQPLDPFARKRGLS
jgi:hypothetical protein